MRSARFYCGTPVKTFRRGHCGVEVDSGLTPTLPLLVRQRSCFSRRRFRSLGWNENDLLRLAQVLGHSDINMTARYTKRTEGQLADASERLVYDQLVLGHENLNTTARYTKRTEGPLAEASERLVY